MEKERFIEIIMEEGYTKEEAERLWAAKPQDIDPEEGQVRRTAKFMKVLYTLDKE